MEFRKKRFFGIALLAGALALSTYAFTAGNTVPATKAGDGSGDITGYAVSTVKYNLDSTNPKNIASVTFSLDTAPTTGSTVKIQLDDPSGAWYSCTLSGTPATNASCTTTGATVLAADKLTVVAAD